MTYRELQQALRTFKEAGKTYINLNSSKAALQAEYDRVTTPESAFNTSNVDRDLKGFEYVKAVEEWNGLHRQACKTLEYHIYWCIDTALYNGEFSGRSADSCRAWFESLTADQIDVFVNTLVAKYGDKCKELSSFNVLDVIFDGYHESKSKNGNADPTPSEMVDKLKAAKAAFAQAALTQEKIRFTKAYNNYFSSKAGNYWNTNESVLGRAYDLFKYWIGSINCHQWSYREVSDQIKNDIEAYTHGQVFRNNEDNEIAIFLRLQLLFVLTA